MDIIICPAVKEDYAAVKKLMVQSWQHHMNLRPDTYILPENFFDEKVYEQLLAEAYQLVAIDEAGNVVGAVSYSITQMKSDSIIPFDCLWIADLAVDENCRRMGVAGKLLEAIKSTAREKGIDRIQLNVNALNSGAISLYEKQGFVPEMIRMEYILDKEG